MGPFPLLPGKRLNNSGPSSFQKGPFNNYVNRNLAISDHQSTPSKQLQQIKLPYKCKQVTDHLLSISTYSIISTVRNF